MEEINQKRKVKGRVDGVKSLINMTADIASLTGIAAGGAIAVKSVVAGGDLAHKGAKYLQQRSRDNTRTEVEGKIKTEKGKASGEMGALESLKDYQDVAGRGFVDKSRKQKETEYRRHARYVLDRVSLIPEITNPQDQGQVTAAQSEYRNVKKLMKATGVDLYDFLPSTWN